VPRELSYTDTVFARRRRARTITAEVQHAWT
jgi:hypothetical protein